MIEKLIMLNCDPLKVVTFVKIRQILTFLS